MKKELDVGSYEDNRSVIEIGILLKIAGELEEALEVFLYVQRSIEMTRELKSERHLSKPLRILIESTKKASAEQKRIPECLPMAPRGSPPQGCPGGSDCPRATWEWTWFKRALAVLYILALIGLVSVAVSHSVPAIFPERGPTPAKAPAAPAAALEH